VATTVKHFAGNEAEFERHTINSVVDERTLREIYLVPFEAAVRDAGALGVMTAYNRLNGPFCAESAALIAEILRGDWGFDGFVLTDWFANGSTDGSARAGLDLEMPGPGRFYGPALAEAVRAGAVDETLVDEMARRLLGVFARIGALDDGDGGPAEPDEAARRVLAREAATSSFVLLQNDGLLPLLPDGGTVAVIGPNAARAQIMGGGSSAVLPHHRTTPLDALRARLGDRVEVVHERGCDIERTAPPIAGPLDVELFAGHEREGPVAVRATWREARMLSMGSAVPGVGEEQGFSLRATGRFTADETGTHTLTLVQAGRARVLVDGEVVLDGTSGALPHGDQLFGLGSIEIEHEMELVAGEPHDLVIEYSSRGSAGIYGLKVGWRLPGDERELLERAVAAASAADAVVLVVGTNDDWETEGRDRDTMRLPGAQDELVASTIAANPRSVVVVNAGSPIEMAWAPDAATILQVWFGGEEMADALVDVLVGEAEPAGRLPTTFPERLEHNPSFGNFPGEHGEVRYGEGLLVGYRWYDTRGIPARFPFGHGLSYTSFEIGEPRLASPELSPGGQLTIEVDVRNTGRRRGAEVIQCYVAPVAPRVFRPAKELKAFAKVWLDPASSCTETLVLAERAFAIWDPTAGSWRVEPGEYDLHLGRSAADIAHVVRVTVPDAE
jgi:beta-glucosidase